MEKEMHLNSLYTEHFLPENELALNPIDSQIAYELIEAELSLETNEKQNLATFCQTYMEPHAEKLITQSLSKNLIDKTEYPKVTDIEQRCLRIIEKLWHGNNTIGTSTIGSSEGCMLAGLNMKKRWQQANPHLSKPNIIISSAYQVCWEKFAVYFDVELKLVPLDENNLSLNVQQAIELIDENTIGVVSILGVTYTGLYDNVELLNNALTTYNQNANFPLYIHVDAASGGLFAPFVDTKLKWDFDLDNVISINCSGHKYGLAYPGIGWVLFKNEQFVSEDILFNVGYLGGNVSTMGMNSASHLIAQYYNFTRLGQLGYHKIHTKTQAVAKYLYEQLVSLNIFTFINDGSNLPILCYYLNDDNSWNLYALSDQLLKYGWQIPSYTLSSNLNSIVVSRIVIRADFTFDYAENLITDIKQTIDFLNANNINTNNFSSFTH